MHHGLRDASAASLAEAVTGAMTDEERHAPAAASEFGPLLTKVRLAKGLSQKDLARIAGYNPSTISRVEASGRGVSRELVERLAAVLEVTAATRLELLAAAGLVDEEVAILLESPTLTQLSRLLAQPNIRPDDRARLLQYVDLALAHADALGYQLPPAWPGPDE